jgi:hypothetical protein
MSVANKKVLANKNVLSTSAAAIVQLFSLQTSIHTFDNQGINAKAVQRTPPSDEYEMQLATSFFSLHFRRELPFTSITICDGMPPSCARFIICCFLVSNCEQFEGNVLQRFYCSKKACKFFSPFKSLSGFAINFSKCPLNAASL